MKRRIAGPRSGPTWTWWLVGACAATLPLAGPYLERQLLPTEVPGLKTVTSVTHRAAVGFRFQPPVPATAGRTTLRWVREPASVRVQAGQVLVAAGETVRPFERALLKVARGDRPSRSDTDFFARLGALFFVFVLIHGLVFWLLPRPLRDLRRGVLVAFLLGLAPLCTHAIKLFADLPLGCAPLGVAALLCGVTVGRQVALLVAAGSVALVGLAGAASGGELVLLASGCLVASVFLRQRRLLQLGAGVVAAAVVQLGLALVLDPVPPPVGVAPPAGLWVLWSGLGILVAGLLALVLCWPVLRWAGVSSAFRLRRLTSARHPLMWELRRRAPGTYQHSQNVAYLAEAGADAVGADRALARAGACYHDLGKIMAAELFVENREPGEADPSEELTPAETATALARHVPDGLQLARRYRLPREIRDLLHEHHGTTPLEAPLRRANQEGRDIDPGVYYYPGPLPQTRESAILMVADAVEAASRRIDDPTLAALGEVVEQVVDRRLREHQFEECDLTQEELLAVQERMIKSLRQALHRRVHLDRSAEEK